MLSSSRSLVTSRILCASFVRGKFGTELGDPNTGLYGSQETPDDELFYSSCFSKALSIVRNHFGCARRQNERCFSEMWAWNAKEVPAVWQVSNLHASRIGRKTRHDVTPLNGMLLCSGGPESGDRSLYVREHHEPFTRVTK